MESFKKLGLSEEIVKAIKAKGYTTPTEIQEKTIPPLLNGNQDVVGQAQTGTGKTASFALPIIETVKGGDGEKALILTPTRELAVQITKEFDSLKGSKKLKVLTVYGGASIINQINALKAGIDIVVGTPGRVMDLLRRRKLNLSNIDYCVLDEADEMLNMGFIDDIEVILKQTSKKKKMMLFSATMPGPIKKIAQKFMNNPLMIKTETKDLATDLVDQIYYDINSRDRFEALRRVMDISEDFYGIIFCKTKLEVDHLSKKLVTANYPAGALHGDVNQGQREKILSQFKLKRIKILVATDVAARGIDVENLTHVINYSLPQSPDHYVHRIGRTGRAGKKGIAITFVIPSEKGKLKHVEREAGCKITRKTLPKIQDVVNAKSSYLEDKAEKISHSGTGRFDELAEKLISDKSHHKVVSALLEYAFGKITDNYQEVEEVSGHFERSDRRGRDRHSRRRDGGRRDGRRREGPRRDSSRSEGRARHDSKPRKNKHSRRRTRT